MTTSRSYTWATRREGNQGFVQETCTEGPDLIYRKVFEMRPNVVPAFVDARRRVIAMEMQEAGRPYVELESGVIN